MLVPMHPHAPRVQTLLEAAKTAAGSAEVPTLGSASIGLEMIRRCPRDGNRSDATTTSAAWVTSLRARGTTARVVTSGSSLESRSMTTTARSKRSLTVGSGPGHFLRSSLLDPRPVTTHNDWTRAALDARRFEGWATFEDLVATVSFERASWGRG